MRKISKLLSAALLMGALMANTSCEEDVFNNLDPDGPEEDVSGVIEDFTVTLDYKGDAKTGPSGFDADTKKVVDFNDSSADLVTCWQYNYGDIISQPAGSYITTLYRMYNDVNYTNSNTCTIQNLGKVNISDFADKITMSELNPKSGSIPNLSGVNQVQVEPGDVIAFKTSQGTVGVAKVSSISKFSRKFTLTGYLYYANSAK